MRSKCLNTILMLLVGLQSLTAIADSQLFDPLSAVAMEAQFIDSTAVFDAIEHDMDLD